MASLSRRQFLGTSLKLGAGAAALGLSGVGLGTDAEAWASPVPDGVAPPPKPRMVQTFVSRPDITPPGVSISATGHVPSRPARILAAPRIVFGSGQPPSSQGLMIMNLNGSLVWWQEMSSPGASAFNFRVQTYRGRPVLTWYQGQVLTSYGTGGKGMIADETYSTVGITHARNWGTDLHEFLITPDDTALVTAYENIGNGKLLVSHAQEVGIGGANELLWDWPSYPSVSPALSYTGTGGDYFHINSVDLWPGSARDVLISSRNTSAIYLVSRRTKKVIWRLGGKASSWAAGAGTRFSYQHDARALADGSGLSLFDDASGGLTEKQSWGKVITLNQKTRQASLRHQFSHPTSPIDSGSQGNCQLLPTGGHFVGWGSNPYFSLYGPSGNAVRPPLLLDGRFPPGIQNYRAFMFDWTGRPPVSQLALVVRGGASSSTFAAYTSWNGATQVSYWEVSAGTSPATLRPVSARVHATGFETAIPFSAPGARDFQVTAMDSKGRVLGRSRVVGLTVA